MHCILGIAPALSSGLRTGYAELHCEFGADGGSEYENVDHLPFPE